MASSVEHVPWPPGASPETFAANLEVLARSALGLAERLCQAVQGGHVRERGAGLAYVLHGAEQPLDVGPARARELAAEALRGAPDGRVLVLGAGRGELVRAALDGGARRVVAWDADPWLLRLVLGAADWRAELADGRLAFALGTDLLDLADGARLRHPLLAEVYAPELELLGRPLARDRALLCRGGLCVESLRRALVARGWSVWTLDVERLSQEELDLAAHRVAPGLVASVNHREGLAEWSRQHGARLLVWEIDPATDTPRPVVGPSGHAHVFTYRRAHVELFRAAGFEHVEHLPLAADAELRRPPRMSPAERERYAAPVSFVGSSMVDNALRHMRELRGACERYAAAVGGPDPWPAVEEVLAVQRGLPRSWVAGELLEERLPGFPGWCRSRGERSDPLALLGEIAASEKRLGYVASLAAGAPRGRVHVWGDEGWRCIEAHGVRYRGPAGHLRDLNRVYAASTVNLDVGRLYQSDIATLRVFDVLACGGFALVERSEDVERLFEVGVELDAYDGAAELRAKVEHWLARPARTREIAARGRAAVLERHSLDLRVDHMLAGLSAGDAERPLRSYA